MCVLYNINEIQHYNPSQVCGTLASANGNACKFEWQHLHMQVKPLANASNGIPKTSKYKPILCRTNFINSSMYSFLPP